MPMNSFTFEDGVGHGALVAALNSAIREGGTVTFEMVAPDALAVSHKSMLLNVTAVFMTGTPMGKKMWPLDVSKLLEHWAQEHRTKIREFANDVEEDLQKILEEDLPF